MRASWVHGGRLGIVAAMAGAAALIVLGLLTLGVQASARPHHVPLAVAVPPGSTLDPLAARITGLGGDAVDWRVLDPAEAARQLDATDIYGYLTLTPGPDGRGVTVGAVESGALVPTATAAADGVLRAAGNAVAAHAGAGAPVTVATVQTVHPTSPAGKALPLAATTLLWIGGLAGSGLLLFVARRGGGRPTRAAQLVLVAGNALLGTTIVFTFSHIWDGGVAWNWGAAWFLILVGGAFAALQAAVLRLLGAAGLPILGLLYLMAPAVSGQPPELLHPAYRALLWSWSPIRIATEATRSLLYLDTIPDDVVAGWIVFGLLAGIGLAVLVWPTRTRPAAPAPAAARATRELVAALALELLARRLTRASGHHPALTEAAARLAPDGGNTEVERARTAARTILHPAARHVLTG